MTMSPKCEEDANNFIWQLNQETPEEYAVLMYDAFGKIGSDVKGGNINRFGLMGECHSARAPTFFGQYCQVYFQQGRVEYFVAVCVPDSCNEEDVQFLVVNDSLQFEDMSLIPPIPSILVNGSRQMSMTYCLPRTISPDSSEIICLTAFCIMVAIPLAATLATAIIRWRKNRRTSQPPESSPITTELNVYGTVSSEEQNDSKTPVCSPKICLDRLLQEFSLQNTCQGVLSTTSGGTLSSLSGIRILSLIWITYGHSSMALPVTAIDNWNTMKTKIYNIFHFVASNGRPTLAVDTFFLMSGLLSVVSLMSACNRAGGKLSLFLVANYVFNRFKRVQPLHLFMMCLCMSVYSLVVWGPNWMPTRTSYSCRKYWWTHILLINNLFPQTECLLWTWYLAVDFQCYLTTPVLVLLYKLNRIVFGFVAGILMLATIGVSVFVFTQLPLDMSREYEYINRYYVKAHTRYGPFLVGILTGLYLTTKTEPLVNKKWKAALGWCCSLSVLAAIMLLGHILETAGDSILYYIFQSVERTLWAAAVSWIIVACDEGYGGFINRFLSATFWIPFTTISFASYLIHPAIVLFYIGLQQTPIHATNLNTGFIFFGIAVVTMPLSYVLTVLIEKPYFIK